MLAAVSAAEGGGTGRGANRRVGAGGVAGGRRDSGAATAGNGSAGEKAMAEAIMAKLKRGGMAGKGRGGSQDVESLQEQVCLLWLWAFLGCVSMAGGGSELVISILCSETKALNFSGKIIQITSWSALGGRIVVAKTSDLVFNFKVF